LHEKIYMKRPVVEIDGDEMARVMWSLVKELLLEPYVDLKTEYYDLGLRHRDETDDRVTAEAANAIKRIGIGVKCATITPNAERVKEYGLKNEWPSPNATIRKVLGGTIFRKPILLRNVIPAVRSWKKPIVIARHAFGDIYDGEGLEFGQSGYVELSFKSGTSVNSVRKLVTGPGIAEVKVNSLSSIEEFARSCFNYALDERMDLWFAAKDTISKVYDAKFKQIFGEIYEKSYAQKFRAAGITYSYFLIDDALSRVVRSEGGFVWAAKNYDGDILSDLISSGFGSLALMTSELYSPDGFKEFEAAHGTVQRHYYAYLKGEPVHTNPIATIFAWTGALRARGKADDTPQLSMFSDTLEWAVKKTVEADGVMTKDVASMSAIPPSHVATLQEFLTRVQENLELALGRGEQK